MASPIKAQVRLWWESVAFIILEIAGMYNTIAILLGNDAYIWLSVMLEMRATFMGNFDCLSASGCERLLPCYWLDQCMLDDLKRYPKDHNIKSCAICNYIDIDFHFFKLAHMNHICLFLNGGSLAHLCTFYICSPKLNSFIGHFILLQSFTTVDDI